MKPIKTVPDFSSAAAIGFHPAIAGTTGMARSDTPADMAGVIGFCRTAVIPGHVEGCISLAAPGTLHGERLDIAGISGPGILGGPPGTGDDPDACRQVVGRAGATSDCAPLSQAGP